MTGEPRAADHDRVAQLARDIETIPDVVDRLAGDALASSVHAALADVAGRRPRRLLVAGLGSSRYAALQAEASLRATGLDVEVHPASSDALPRLGDGLCIAISSSGRTPETVAVAARYRGTAPVLAVTQNPASPLAQAADAVIRLPVEPEASGVAVPSFVATIGVLEVIAAELNGLAKPAFEPLAARALAILDARATWLPMALGAVDGGEEIAVLAPWSSRGLAEQSAMLFRECPRRAATAFETGDWLHVGVYTALPGSVVLLFEGSPGDAEVERTVLGRGGRLVRVRSLGPGDGVALPEHEGRGAGVRDIARFTGPAVLAAEWWRAVAKDPWRTGRG